MPFRLNNKGYDHRHAPSFRTAKAAPRRARAGRLVHEPAEASSFDRVCSREWRDAKTVRGARPKGDLYLERGKLQFRKPNDGVGETHLLQW